MNEEDDKLETMMGQKLFDVEHALSMYALSFFHFPAKHLYDVDLLEKLGSRVQNCHIYLVGIVPVLDLVGVRQEDRTLVVEFESKGQSYEVKGPIPDGLDLHHDEEYSYLSDGQGDRFAPSDEQIMQAFQAQYGLQEFDVVYIGQAYGKNGSRSALDRLRRHETLQKIALKGVPDGFRLELLLLEIQPNTTMFTMFNPRAQDKANGPNRIRAGIDKLYGTNEHERITLYEASLIRHFRPPYNIEFKDTFPSTSLKVLADCYDKDFAAIIAEICFDHPPYLLRSDAISPCLQHVVRHNLHKEEDRKVFFSQE